MLYSHDEFDLFGCDGSIPQYSVYIKGVDVAPQGGSMRRLGECCFPDGSKAVGRYVGCWLDCGSGCSLFARGVFH